MGKRSELGERTFIHILNHGGMRRTTLSGHRNVYKRMLIAGLAFNLSIHSWHVHGVGTPKQALAGNRNPCPGRPRGPVAIPWGPMDAILGAPESRRWPFHLAWQLVAGFALRPSFSTVP